MRKTKSEYLADTPSKTVVSPASWGAKPAWSPTYSRFAIKLRFAQAAAAFLGSVQTHWNWEMRLYLWPSYFLLALLPGLEPLADRGESGFLERNILPCVQSAVSQFWSDGKTQASGHEDEKCMCIFCTSGKFRRMMGVPACRSALKCMARATTSSVFAHAHAALVYGMANALTKALCAGQNRVARHWRSC